MPTESNVDLGFAEESEPALLRNVYFPSKIGGRPAWLDLDKIPSVDDLKCKQCSLPKSFLCQIYAPIDKNPECLHRTLYIFICRESGCFKANSANNVTVFRSQLPKENKFYPPIPPENQDLPSLEPTFKLCRVCGCRGPLMCSRCKCTHYCSTKHQQAHWRQHKKFCPDTCDSEPKEPNVPTVNFPEFQIAVEQEELDTEISKDDDAAEHRRLKEYKTLVEEGKSGTLSDISEADLQKYLAEGENKGDSFFQRFKKRIAIDPDQVIRYEIGGQPLWIADPSVTMQNEGVPNCEDCGSERQFECQVMPQMLNFLKDDNLDWGVLVVYSCKNSCNKRDAYSTEIVIKQDIPNDLNQ